MASTEELRSRWNILYRTTLPSLAKARDRIQPEWPVQLDHCFARIILDNAVGITRPWTAAIESPAWKNMTREQLIDAIELGESIAVGEASLQDLNERSLELRGKVSKQGGKRKREISSLEDDGTHAEGHDAANQAHKAKRGERHKESISFYFKPRPTSSRANEKSSVSGETKAARDGDSSLATSDPDTTFTNPITDAEFSASDPLKLISTSRLSPFRKQVLTLLCRVPRGRYTTYAALSEYISKTSHKTCARAVGNAMRNNPFAPAVPCHRVLAHDGQIGGFGGHWGEEGKYAHKKLEMLREEGLKFDGRKRAVGEAFKDFEP